MHDHLCYVDTYSGFYIQSAEDERAAAAEAASRAGKLIVRLENVLIALAAMAMIGADTLGGHCRTGHDLCDHGLCGRGVDVDRWQRQGIGAAAVFARSGKARNEDRCVRPHICVPRKPLRRVG